MWCVKFRIKRRKDLKNRKGTEQLGLRTDHIGLFVSVLDQNLWFAYVRVVSGLLKNGVVLMWFKADPIRLEYNFGLFGTLVLLMPAKKKVKKKYQTG